MGHHTRSRVLLITAAVALGASLLSVVQPSGATPSVEAQPADPSDPCVGDGLRNPGFEAASATGAPSCWTVSQPINDRVLVVGEEGPSTSAVYAEKGITVTPQRGEKMLALGNPKQQGESQAKNPDTVTQTFKATSSSFELQLKVFSWEPAGNDEVKVAISGGDGAATTSLTLAVEDDDQKDWIIGGCATPSECTFSFDTGRRNDKNLLETTWSTATFSGLEKGVDYTVEITIGGTKRTSFATWGYVDDVNSPPVAKFDIDRAQDCSFAPVGTLYEGQPIPLADCSEDPDGFIESREWTVTYPGGSEDATATDTRESGFVIPSDQGTPVVSLTVTDNEGQQDTIVVGGGFCADGITPGATASDGTCVPALVVSDAPPLVDAVDVQAVVGSTVELVARYGDAGVFDDHTVTVDGGEGLNRCSDVPEFPCFEADGLPAVSSGIVLAEVTAPAEVTDPDSGSMPIPIPVEVTDATTGQDSTDTAIITAIADDPTQFEGQFPRSVSVGKRYADWIDRPGDIDLFEVTWPSSDGPAGEGLPIGTELLVSLRDLPTDYDVAVLVGRGDAVPGSEGGVLPGSFTPGSFTPGSFTPGSFTPGSFTPGSFTPGSFTPGSFTPGSFTPGSFTPGSFTPGSFTPGSFTPGSFTPFISELFRPPSQLLPGQIFPGTTVEELDSLYDPRLVDDDLGLLDPFAVNPFQLYPISQRSFTGASGTGLADINIDELGLGPIAEGLKVAGSSANRGTNDDVVVARVDEVGAEVYVVVIGANGEFSSDPYSLQIEGSVPFDSLALAAGATELFGGTCSRDDDPRGPRGGGGDPTPATFIDAGDQETLFVTSWDRLEWSARTDDDASTVPGTARDAITVLAANVGGSILDVSTSAFTDWDKATCDPSAANAVADDVREQVLTELANRDYKHVVVIGGDDVIPFRRVIDETGFANETQYAMPSFLDPGQPLFASKAGGYNLTDSHLTDAEPTPWRGRSLWVSDTSTSRLVETELEIAAQAEAFRLSNGMLDLNTALVTGSEFFADGATEIAGVLGGESIIDPADSNVSSADDYRCALFGEACGLTDGGVQLTGDVNSINAHFQHFAAFSPLGAADGDPDQAIFTSEVNDALAGTLFMTIGCHGGLAVPDDEVLVDELAPGVRSSLDWAQALAQQQAVMIGNTGYGLGETEGVAYTELLHRYIAEELFVQPTVGDAVNEAVKRYLLSVTQFDEYHEKTLIQTVLYGLPFYGTGATSDGATPAAQALAEPAVSAALTAGDTFLVDTAVNDGEFDQEDIRLPGTTTTRGSYYAGRDGLVLSKLNRPKQPLEVDEIVQTDDPVHGVVIGDGGGPAGRYLDLEDFDPVIQSPTSEWLAPTDEPPVCLDAWWPSTLARVNTLEVAAGDYRQTVSATPGQFRCRSVEEPANGSPFVIGTQRIFDELPLTLVSSPSDDWQAPVIRQVDFQPTRDAEDNLDLGVTFVLDSNDDVTDLDRIVVLLLHDGVVTSEVKVKDVPAPTGLTKEGSEVSLALSGLQPETGLIFQLVDGAGNVTTYTGKSTVPSIIEIDATGPPVAVEGEELTLTIRIPGYEAKVDTGELVEPVWYAWDFGADVTLDGDVVNRTSGLVAEGASGGVDIRFENGDAVIETTVVYDATADDPIIATARVADSDGAVGIDDHVMRLRCDGADVPDYPDADLIGCGLELVETSTGAAGVGFVIEVVGVISPEYQYRIGFDTDGNGGVDKTVKWDNGGISGGPLDVEASLNEAGDALTVIVPLADVVTACPDDPSGESQCVIWQIETQGGIQGGSGLGFLDRARDELTVTPVP